MGFRFRRRLKILPGLWINLSKGSPFALNRRQRRDDQYREERDHDHTRHPRHRSFLSVRPETHAQKIDATTRETVALPPTDPLALSKVIIDFKWAAKEPNETILVPT
jgi:hypothetical protein